MNELRPLLDRVNECIHCGFCLPTCPTYSELGTEMDSPRGRIYLVKALAEGKIQPTGPVHRHLDGCLDCRACETACPSGVHYGAIIEGARTILEPFRRRPLWERAARWFAFRHLLPNRRHLALVVSMLRVYQESGLSAMLPAKLRRMDQLAPKVTGRRAFSGSVPRVISAVPPKRGRVALFVGCIMDQAMASIHHATARVLARNGFDVVIPHAQTCCGALHVHNGMGPIAKELARRNVAVFQDVDRVIINSAGCGAQIREYHELLGRSTWLEKNTADVSVFLAEVGLRQPTAPIRRRAIYDEPCHLLHAQGVSKQPKELLSKIPGLEILPLQEAEWCCGSAGIYNLTQPEMSQRLLHRKMDFVAATGANLLVTANPGCLLQLQAGVRQRGLAMSVVHLVELLDQAYGRGPLPG